MKYTYIRFYFAGRVEVEDTFEETVEEAGYDFYMASNKVLSGELSMADAVEREVRHLYKRYYTPDRVDFITEFADLIKSCGGDTEKAYAMLCRGVEDQLKSIIDAIVFDLIDEHLEGDPEDDTVVNPSEDEDDGDDDDDDDDEGDDAEESSEH